MPRCADFLLTLLAPTVWGSTYAVTTELLPNGHPLTVALLRALPAGLILLLVVRRLPWGRWWPRVLVLGFLNFTLFWSLLFIAAYRLPGGVAATIIAVQPLMVLALARVALGSSIRPWSVMAGIGGLVGVALLILTPEAAMDGPGIAAALAGAAAMAAGTVFTRVWQPPVSALTVTAWQLAAGGLLLLPLALIVDPLPTEITTANVAGVVYLGIIGAAASYLLWFRGIARLGPSAVAPLSFFSPLTAVLIGWLFLGQSFSPLQGLGAALVLLSVLLAQGPPRRAKII